MTERFDLAVLGGGIAGLAAAWEAVRQGARVVVLEAADRVGGKLRTTPLAGIPLDESADAFLARVPEGIELCRELGIDGELVSPRTGRAYVWSQGALRQLPAEQLLGVPTDLDAVAASGILSPEGLARAAEDLSRPAGSRSAQPDARHGGDARRPVGRPAGATSSRTGADDTPAGGGPEDDEAVGRLIRRRLGDEVLDRLVGPLIGGIWAGDCDRLSVQVAAPALAEASHHDPSLIRGAAALRAARMPAPRDAPTAPDPVFLTPRGGMGRLVEALVEALGDRVRTGQEVVSLHREPHGTRPGRWRVEPAGIVADAVVVATPAFAAAPLLAPHSPEAAHVLDAVEHASIAMLALAVPRDGIDHDLDGSGFLVPPSEGRLLTACSWTSSKWGHLAGDGTLALLRASAGRDGDPRALALDDDALVAALLDDLHKTMGLQAEPADARVTRWPRSFPQPRPGHLARVATVETALAREAPGLAVAGAWMRGVGVPACIRSGRQAAARLLDVRSSAPR